MIKLFTTEFRRLMSDERGAEGLEKILLVGALILPLLGILIYFKDNITEWMQGIWEEVETDNADYKYDG